MSQSTYMRLTNVCVIVAVAAIIAYDNIGSYGWIALVVAGATALVAVISYFRLHWSKSSQDQSEVITALVAEASLAAHHQAQLEDVRAFISSLSHDSPVGWEDRLLAGYLREPGRGQWRLLAAYMNAAEKKEWSAEAAARLVDSMWVANGVVNLQRARAIRRCQAQEITRVMTSPPMYKRTKSGPSVGAALLQV